MGYVTDNIIFLSDIAKCIAMQFGKNCEVVLHDLTIPNNKTIIAIWNGHITGRKIGDSITNAGLQILKNSVSPEDHYHYINTTPGGKILCSSIKYFKDEDGKVNGCLCINLDITYLIHCHESLQLFIYPDKELPSRSSSELFISNINCLMEDMINDAILSTGKKIKDLTRENKVDIVKSLNKKGFFQIKKSTETLANFLGLSRYSIYNYINEK